MLKKLVTLVGIALVAAGVLGFVPAAAPNGLLFGLFHVNTAHNLVHIVSGVAALAAGYGGCCGVCKCADWWTPRMFFRVFGVVYGIVAVLGFWHGDAPVLGYIANNFADNVLHTVIAVVSLYLGFVHKCDTCCCTKDDVNKDE